jgi:chemosensory pili system protein ChpA (sensor histidine kinase/response regulator)
MGFLIDMLSYQRALAKKFFVYDEELGELRPLMGREKAAAHSAPEGAPVVQAAPAPRAPQPAPAPYVPAPSSAASSEEDDGELTDIFLEEAREVVQKGHEALQALVEDPTNLADQTTLRRAFHTLKGSSRMVGLNDFGEAAWAFEQVLNTSLAEQRPASDAMISVAGDALRALGRWVEDIAGNTGVPWNAQDFRECADALRLRNTQLPLKTPVPLDSIEASPSPKLVDLPLLAEDESSPSSAYPEFADTKTVKEDEGGPESQGGFSATEIPGDLLPDLEIPLSDFPSIPTVGDASTDSHAASSAKAAFNAATEVIEGDLGDFDFGDLGAQPPAVDTAAPAAPVATTATEEFSLELPDLSDYSEHTASASLAEPEVPVASPEPRSPLPEFEQETDDGIKVIGPLRLSIPLYNVYLNEADEWSRRLQTELSEWALEVQKPLPDAVVSLAHSLLGSSATVGFVALSEMARALEQALQHVQLHRQGTAEQATVFCNAAEDIRRLLHQFAAGFLKEADDGILEALQRIIETEFPAATMESAPASLPEVALPDDWAATGMESLQDLVIEPEPETQAAALSEPVMEPVAETVTEAGPFAAYEPELAPVPEPVAEQVPVAPVAVPAPLNVAQAQDVDIDAVDSLDPDLLPIFEEEAQELMPQMGTALRQWMARPDNLSARSEVLRLLHTLKGSARLAGAMRLGEMSHHMESSIEQIGTENLQAVQIEPLLTRFDTLQNTFANLGKSEEELDAQAPSAAPHTAPESVKDAAKGAAQSPATPARKVDIQSITQTHILPPVRSTGNQSVRVRSQLLDRLVNQAGEVMISRSRMDSRLTQLRTSLGELDGNLDRLRKQLRDVELQAESQMQSRLAQTKDSAQAFDPLEFDRFTRVQELTRMMAESVNDVATVQRNLQRSVEGTEDDLIAQGRQARELQRDLLKTRMVEFEGISDRLYGVVRQAAKDTGKQVKLDITGGTIEMDRGVLERMAPAFEHMLRNAVAHGVEDAASRTAAGKSAAGEITINVAQESNDVSVTFSDDGAGLNFDKIRAKAIANGLIQDGDHLSEGDVANLIFTPGFSTADQVTELAGRGIGMDIVRSEVNALGGRIETSATQGKGTSFKLVLPLTTAVTQVVIMRIGTFSIGVPANLLETILRVPSTVLDQSYERDGFDFAGEIIPFYWAGALLQESARSHEATGKTLPVAIFRSAGQRLAMHVDEVLGNREVVVKNLGPQLARLPGLAGMSVLASGAVVLIYNPVALATVYGEQAKQFGKASAQETATEAAGDTPTSSGAAAVPDQLPLVLVVDDSITVRRVTQRLLKREGYRVALANDGLQAIERLQEEKPAVVLSDIEMPRMDGFDLARNIRGDARLSDLPIIMITSRIADKHREHARQLGVDHYLGKPYSEEELLGLIRGYCAVPAAN